MQRKFLVAICLTVFLSCLAMVANMNRVSAMVLEPKVTADIAGTYRISQVWKFKYGRYDDKVVDPLRNFVGRIVRVKAEVDDISLIAEYDLTISGYVVPEPNEIDPKYMGEAYEDSDIESSAGHEIIGFYFDNQKPTYTRDNRGGVGHPCYLHFLKDKYNFITDGLMNCAYVVIKPDSLLFYHYGDYGHWEWNFVENYVREPILELKRIE